MTGTLSVESAALHGIAALDVLSAPEAEAALLRCCGSPRWARAVTALRPFCTPEALVDAAADVWEALTTDDWRQAFAAHPRIGAALNPAKSVSALWSASEQSGTSVAADEQLQELARLNYQYEARFGHTFIVCATGLSVGEMLARLRDRISNAPQQELTIAAREQAKITTLRLHKLIATLAEDRTR